MQNLHNMQLRYNNHLVRQRHNLHTAALLILCKRLHLAGATHLGMRLPIAGATDLVHDATFCGDINSLQHYPNAAAAACYTSMYSQLLTTLTMCSISSLHAQQLTARVARISSSSSSSSKQQQHHPPPVCLFHHVPLPFMLFPYLPMSPQDVKL